MTEKKKIDKKSVAFWALIWGLGLIGQICWNMENQWFNTFVYAKIAKNPIIVSYMTAFSAVATTFSTFFFGTLSDRTGNRRIFVSLGYIIWGVFTILFGCTQYIMDIGGSAAIIVAGVAVVLADMIMSFFGSMGNDAGYNAWANDNMTDNNRGQIGAALATQPAIGTIIGTVIGGMLIGEDQNYMRLFLVMGLIVVIFGIFSLFTLKDEPNLKPVKNGTFWQQFGSVFNFKKFFEMKELVWVNVILAVFFVGFNVYFLHLGNYMIYYLGFKEDMMGYIEAAALVLAMFLTSPAIKLINSNKSPWVVIVCILINVLGLGVLFFVRPENVITTTIFNPVLLIGIFLVGAGYMIVLQATLTWSKALYPEGSKGQFEGVRILFYVLIPMVVAPLISNPIIMANGEFINAYGEAEYLPTHTLFIAGIIVELLAIIPTLFAKKFHDKRIAEHTVV